MALTASRTGLTLQDAYTGSTQIIGLSIDRLDVHCWTGDLVLQLQQKDGNWGPEMLIRKGEFRSLPGLSLAYPPNGPTGFQLRRAVAGVASTVDIEAWSVGD